MDDFDIYADLPSYHINDAETEISEKVSNLKEENEAQLKEINEWKQKFTEEVTLNKTLATNLSSLLKTAKVEINRKDKIIAELRTKLEDLRFRRDKRSKLNNLQSLLNINKNDDVGSHEGFCQLDQQTSIPISDLEEKTHYNNHPSTSIQQVNPPSLLSLDIKMPPCFLNSQSQIEESKPTSLLNPPYLTQNLQEPEYTKASDETKSSLLVKKSRSNDSDSELSDDGIVNKPIYVSTLYGERLRKKLTAEKDLEKQIVEVAQVQDIEKQVSITVKNENFKNLVHQENHVNAYIKNSCDPKVKSEPKDELRSNNEFDSLFDIDAIENKRKTIKNTLQENHLNSISRDKISQMHYSNSKSNKNHREHRKKTSDRSSERSLSKDSIENDIEKRNTEYKNDVNELKSTLENQGIKKEPKSLEKSVYSNVKNYKENNRNENWESSSRSLAKDTILENPRKKQSTKIAPTKTVEDKNSSRFLEDSNRSKNSHKISNSHDRHSHRVDPQDRGMKSSRSNLKTGTDRSEHHRKENRKGTSRPSSKDSILEDDKKSDVNKSKPAELSSATIDRRGSQRSRSNHSEVVKPHNQKVKSEQKSTEDRDHSIAQNQKEHCRKEDKKSIPRSSPKDSTLETLVQNQATKSDPENEDNKMNLPIILENSNRTSNTDKISISHNDHSDRIKVHDQQVKSEQKSLAHNDNLDVKNQKEYVKKKTDDESTLKPSSEESILQDNVENLAIKTESISTASGTILSRLLENAKKACNSNENLNSCDHHSNRAKFQDQVVKNENKLVGNSDQLDLKDLKEPFLKDSMKNNSISLLKNHTIENQKENLAPKTSEDLPKISEKSNEPIDSYRNSNPLIQNCETKATSEIGESLPQIQSMELNNELLEDKSTCKNILPSINKLQAEKDLISSNVLPNDSKNSSHKSDHYYDERNSEGKLLKNECQSLENKIKSIVVQKDLETLKDKCSSTSYNSLQPNNEPQNEKDLKCSNIMSEESKKYSYKSDFYHTGKNSETKTYPQLNSISSNDKNHSKNSKRNRSRSRSRGRSKLKNKSSNENRHNNLLSRDSDHQKKKDRHRRDRSKSSNRHRSKDEKRERKAKKKSKDRSLKKDKKKKKEKEKTPHKERKKDRKDHKSLERKHKSEKSLKRKLKTFDDHPTKKIKTEQSLASIENTEKQLGIVKDETKILNLQHTTPKCDENEFEENIISVEKQDLSLEDGEVLDSPVKASYKTKKVTESESNKKEEKLVDNELASPKRILEDEVKVTLVSSKLEHMLESAVRVCVPIEMPIKSDSEHSHKPFSHLFEKVNTELEMNSEDQQKSSSHLFQKVIAELEVNSGKDSKKSSHSSEKINTELKVDSAEDQKKSSHSSEKRNTELKVDSSEDQKKSSDSPEKINTELKVDSSEDQKKSSDSPEKINTELKVDSREDKKKSPHSSEKINTELKVYSEDDQEKSLCLKKSNTELQVNGCKDQQKSTCHSFDNANIETKFNSSEDQQKSSSHLFEKLSTALGVDGKDQPEASVYSLEKEKTEREMNWNSIFDPSGNSITSPLNVANFETVTSSTPNRLFSPAQGTPIKMTPVKSVESGAVEIKEILNGMSPIGDSVLNNSVPRITQKEKLNINHLIPETDSDNKSDSQSKKRKRTSNPIKKQNEPKAFKNKKVVKPSINKESPNESRPVRKRSCRKSDEIAPGLQIQQNKSDFSSSDTLPGSEDLNIIDIPDIQEENKLKDNITKEPKPLKMQPHRSSDAKLDVKTWDLLKNSSKHNAKCFEGKNLNKDTAETSTTSSVQTKSQVLRPFVTPKSKNVIVVKRRKKPMKLSDSLPVIVVNKQSELKKSR